MNALSIASALGLLGLCGGLVLVNIGSSPRAAQIGTAVAAAGVVLLAAVAVAQLVAAAA
jgi:hypothetical protein